MLVGSLRVDVGNTDLAVLEIELLDAVIDGLYVCQQPVSLVTKQDLLFGQR